MSTTTMCNCISKTMAWRSILDNRWWHVWEALPHSDSGGRGLVLLRSVAERIDYERTPQQRNHLRVTVAAGPNQ